VQGSSPINVPTIDTNSATNTQQPDPTLNMPLDGGIPIAVPMANGVAGPVFDPNATVQGSSPVNTPTFINMSDIQNSADPTGAANARLLDANAPGRASSTAELEAAIANGAQAKDLKPSELTRYGAAGGDLAGLGLSPDQIAGLPRNVNEPNSAELGTQGAAVKDFLVNAKGEVDQLTNANVDPSTRGVIAPFDSMKASVASGIDENTVASANIKGSPLTADSSLLALSGRKAPVPSNQPSGALPDQPPSQDKLTQFGRWQDKNRAVAEADGWVNGLRDKAVANDIFAPKVGYSTKGSLDTNPNFVGAPSAATPTYRSTKTGFERTYILPTEASKLVSVTNVAGGTATPASPNPRATVKDQEAWWVDANSGKLNGVKNGGDVAAVINGQYFNTYNGPTTLSFASVENGVIKSTGGIQGVQPNGTLTDPEKLALRWNNAPGSIATIENWSQNTGKRGENGIRMQQSYESIAANTGLTQKDSNLVVGYAPNLTDNTKEQRTLVAVNAQGKIAFLVSQNDITQKEGVQLLKEAGYDQKAMLLDTGASSSLTVKNGATGKGSHEVISDERRKIPNVFVLKK
jgi:hypothetical protein